MTKDSDIIAIDLRNSIMKLAVVKRTDEGANASVAFVLRNPAETIDLTPEQARVLLEFRK